MPTQGRERRRSTRVHLNRRVWCEGEHITLYVPATNASQGGLFLRTATPLSKGKLAKIDLTLEDGALISAEVEVVWSRPPRHAHRAAPGMGVRIVKILRGQEHFARFLEEAAEEVELLS